MKITRMFAVIIAVLLCVLILYIFLHRTSSIRLHAAAIASADPEATQAGVTVLKQGGNAFDATVAVAAALAVVEPYQSGLGGGGFWLIHQASNKRNTFIDSRETAPSSARPNMYMDESDHYIPGSSINGPNAAAIPGEVAGMVYMVKHYGQLTLAKDFAPAIQLAQQGFKVDKKYQRFAKWRLAVLQRYPSSATIYLRNNKVPPLGTLIKQPQLAQTLETIAQEGKAGFYQGPIAETMVQEVKKHGGVWQLKDLQNYHVIVRKPLEGQYHGMAVITAPPPSAGGVGIITMLNILSQFPMATLKPITQLHLILEAMRMAYWQRTLYLGDPDFVKAPLRKLLSLDNAKQLATKIHLHRAMASRELPMGDSIRESEGNTTQISVLDRKGNYVSATLSNNYIFGSGFVVSGTGVLLNDEMDDFAVNPGVPNVYGLIGSRANIIEPGKRPLSSMTPSFVQTPDGVAILGTPGGSRIVSMVLLAILDMPKHPNPEHWVQVKRYHLQYLPDTVQYEPDAFTLEQQKALRKMGYHLKALKQPYGDMQAVYWDTKNNKVLGASDPRGIGQWQVVP